jgi:protein-tyrosine phosphatase
MIDLHCHCLPGVDDGPGSLDEAVALCRAAFEDGCEQIAATPHQRLGDWWNCEPEELRRLCDDLNDRLGGMPRIHLGAEVRIDARLLDDLDSPEHRGILPLAGTDYILLEYSRTGPTLEPEDLVHELTLSGWRPILAHPEFIPRLGDDLDLIRRLVEAGAHIQITAASLTGNFGRRARQIVTQMIDAHLVHFVASDAHDLFYRPPGLAAAARALEDRWGSRMAERLTHSNARKVLANEELAEPSSAHSATGSGRA